MTFGRAISACFSKYANFDDRASRSEYWWFYLFTILIQMLASILGAISGGPEGSDILGGIAALVIIVPIFAVGARRLHDTGKSGWRQLWMITIIGIIPLIIWWCEKGREETNQYGEPIDLDN